MTKIVAVFFIVLLVIVFIAFAAQLTGPSLLTIEYYANGASLKRSTSDVIGPPTTLSTQPHQSPPPPPTTRRKSGGSVSNKTRVRKSDDDDDRSVRIAIKQHQERLRKLQLILNGNADRATSPKIVDSSSSSSNGNNAANNNNNDNDSNAAATIVSTLLRSKTRTTPRPPRTRAPVASHDDDSSTVSSISSVANSVPYQPDVRNLFSSRSLSAKVIDRLRENGGLEHNFLDLFYEEPASSTQRPSLSSAQLLIMSPGDSGQSLVARLLMLMGFYGGEREEFVLHGSSPNPHETWERRDISKLNQLVLKTEHHAVDTFNTAIGFVRSQVSPANLKFFESRLKRIIATLDENWVINSPRAALLSPSYLSLAASPICVFVYRHPLSFARFVLRRRFSDWTIFEWMVVWEKYLLSALQACSGVPKIVVRYDELLATPLIAIGRLRDELHQFGLKTKAPMSDEELLAWLPKLDENDRAAFNVTQAMVSAGVTFGTSDAFDDGAKLLSISQRRLVRAFLTAAAARWTLRDTSAAREFARDGVLLPAEKVLLSGDEELEPPQAVALVDVLSRIALPSTAAQPVQDVIAVYSNNAFVDMVKNLVCNFYALDIARYVIFALDNQLCSELRVIDAPCYFDAKYGEGVGAIQYWTIKANSTYVQLMAMKMNYVNQVLHAGYNILLIDADVVLVDDVRQYIIDKYPDHDLILQSDARLSVLNETESWICAGFFYMRTSPRAIAFMNEIERVMQAVGVNDQDAMQLLLTGHGQKFVFPPSLEYKRASEFGLKWAVLDWYEFPNGETIFDLNAPAERGVRPRIAHANMRPLLRKQKDLRKHSLWYLNIDGDGCIENKEN